MKKNKKWDDILQIDFTTPKEKISIPPQDGCENCNSYGEYCGYCLGDSGLDKNGMPNDSIEEVTKTLEAAGVMEFYDIIPAGPHIIQVDIDSEESLAVYTRNIDIIKDFIKPVKITKSLSKSKRLHVTIETKEWMAPQTRIAIQAILGSDLLREAINFKKVSLDTKNPILFIEPKENDKNVHVETFNY